MKSGQMRLMTAFSGNPEESAEFVAEVKDAFPELEVIHTDPLSLSVSCHIGYGSVAIAAAKSVR